MEELRPGRHEIKASVKIIMLMVITANHEKINVFQFLYIPMHLQLKYASLLKVFWVVVVVLFSLDAVVIWRLLDVVVTDVCEFLYGFGGTGGGAL